MTATEILVAEGPLIGSVARRLPSSIASDYAPVFPGVWYSDLPRPRFGDEVWEISGADPTADRRSWLIDFTEMSPQWSLIAREALYIRINMKQFRDRIVWTAMEREHRFRAGTIHNWRSILAALEE